MRIVPALFIAAKSRKSVIPASIASTNKQKFTLAHKVHKVQKVKLLFYVHKMAFLRQAKLQFTDIEMHTCLVHYYSACFHAWLVNLQFCKPHANCKFKD